MPDTKLKQLIINECSSIPETFELNQLYLTPDTTEEDISNAVKESKEYTDEVVDKAVKSIDLSGYATKTELNTKLSIDTKYGSLLSLTIDNQSYILTAQLKDQNGDNLGTAQTVDLPLETMVVGAEYDENTKELVLTLKNGQTVRFSIADLISGLQPTISDLSSIRSGAEKGSTAVQPDDLSEYAKKENLSKVATSGSYNDLSNKPTIPTKTSQLKNDSDFATNENVNAIKVGSDLSYKDNQLQLLDQDGNAFGNSVEIKEGGSGRNVGDIFYTTRTDTELNGAVECNGGTYNINDFTGKQAIGNLLGLNKVPYVSLSEYASIVSANGSCRAFGWDGGDSFRVPTLKDVYIEAGTALTAGEFVSESLPNIKGYFDFSDNIVKNEINSQYVKRVAGAFTASPVFANAVSVANTVVQTVESPNRLIDFNASNSSATYKNGAKVKPDSVRYRAMVQLANEATDDALITATSALQQVANLNTNKANTSASNFTSTGKATVVGWGMPDYSAGVTYSSDFVAQTNGYCIASNNVGAWGVVKLLADGGVIDQQHNPTSGTSILVYTRGFCKKGQTISKDGVSAWGNIIFYPCIGG